ncbi:hypothetical protein BH24CHL6_BH24CHL6_07550 [soil metagenome]
MTAERLADLIERRRELGEPYLEFLVTDSMSAGLYVLPAGGVDGQSPHTEDEIYVVLAGRSRFSAMGETCDVEPGDTIFVPAGEEHRFHDIIDELRMIVVFQPPEGSLGG